MWWCLRALPLHVEDFSVLSGIEDNPLPFLSEISAFTRNRQRMTSKFVSPAAGLSQQRPQKSDSNKETRKVDLKMLPEAPKQAGTSASNDRVQSHRACCKQKGMTANQPLPSAGTKESKMTLADLESLPPSELATLHAHLSKRLAAQLSAYEELPNPTVVTTQDEIETSGILSSSDTTFAAPAAVPKSAPSVAHNGNEVVGPAPLAVSSGTATTSTAEAYPHRDPEISPPPLDLFEAVKMGLVSVVKRLVREHEVSDSQQVPGNGGRRRALSPSSRLRAYLWERDGDGHTVTHWAAKRGDLELVSLLADKGAPLFEASTDSVGMQPIHWAVTEGHLHVLHYLVRNGADLDARDKQLCTPLLIAAQYGQTEVVAYLVKNGADTKLLDMNDDSSMHWAAYKGELSIVQLLDHLGLPVDDVDGYGQTPLHLAALRGNFSVVEYLVLDADARTDRKDRNGSTPADLALKKGQRKVAAFLASHGLEKFNWRQLLSLQHWKVWLQGGGNAEASAWPFYLVVASNVWVLGLYPLRFFSERGLLALSSHTRLNTCCVALQLSMWAFFLLAWRVDPGYVEGKREGRSQEYEEALETFSSEGMARVLEKAAARSQHHHRQQNGLAPSTAAIKPPLPNLCHACHVVRPVRSKHCRVCRRCVQVFDHHCPFIGNCVGAGNYRWFFLYVCDLLLAALLYIATCVIYLKRAGFDMLVFLTLLYVLSLGLMVGALAGYHSQLVALNFTTNEHQNYWRYDYFRDPVTGRNRNPFDKGVWQNFLARIVYGETYIYGGKAQAVGRGSRQRERTREGDEEEENLLTIV